MSSSGDYGEALEYADVPGEGPLPPPEGCEHQPSHPHQSHLH